MSAFVIPPRGSLAPVVLDRQIRDAPWWRQHLDASQPRVADHEQVLVGNAWFRCEHDYTTANRAVFARALR
ncbi:hypothetical protein SO3561_08998 [Streptomyces olivochromogenes]|uniref:Uncharacterized protein n=1 Tax=Streptomyces olivochromogenes TaxID=1963 RepID=A0A250VT54_STROL|nr:hypothetical protein SO3561_08998 [Streptomyces olivochromogenes]